METRLPCGRRRSTGPPCSSQTHEFGRGAGELHPPSAPLPRHDGRPCPGARRVSNVGRPGRRVAVRAAHGGEPLTAHAVAEVRLVGTGIAEEQGERIFDEFVQVDRRYNRRRAWGWASPSAATRRTAWTASSPSGARPARAAPWCCVCRAARGSRANAAAPTVSINAKSEPGPGLALRVPRAALPRRRVRWGAAGQRAPMRYSGGGSAPMRCRTK
jgi:hypothetical protein